MSTEQALEGSPAPVEFTDAKGRRWIRVREVLEFAAEPEPNEVATGPVSDGERPLTSYPADELAEMLRPIAFAAGYEYTTEPDVELARKVLAGELKLGGQASKGTAPSPEVDTEAHPTAVFPPDERWHFSAHTTYPWRTSVLLTSEAYGGSCTATLIGPSTMITAAHCLHSGGLGGGWFSTRRWNPGANSAATPPYPYNPFLSYPTTWAGNPATYGCYFPAIPTCWSPGVLGAAQTQCDFATLEFAGGFPGTCGYQPGTTVGWLGWGFQTSSQMYNTTGYTHGYAKSGGSCGPTNCPGGDCSWPRMWGHIASQRALEWSSSQPYFISHLYDTGPGQSGMALYNYQPGYPSVFGTHIGCYSSGFATTNRARRMDSTFMSFISANTAL